MAKSKASAVSERSPPLMSDILAKRLPRGWAITSTPDSDGLPGSVSSRRAVPPGNSIENTSLKFLLTRSNTLIKRLRILRSMALAILTRARRADSRSATCSSISSERFLRRAYSSIATSLTGPIEARLCSSCAISASSFSLSSTAGRLKASSSSIDVLSRMRSIACSTCDSSLPRSNLMATASSCALRSSC